MNTVLLTKRDEDVLRALACCVRFFSVEQIVSTWWPDSASSLSNARTRLRRLERSGFIARARVFAEPLPELAGPVFSWKPGEVAPNFGALAWIVKNRWQCPARKTTVYLATKRSAIRFGGATQACINKPDQATHDLGLSAMYLYYLKQKPHCVADWVGEDVFAAERRGQKLPDAILRRDGEIYRVLEFAGRYQSNRLRAFHEDNELRGLSYELW